MRAYDAGPHDIEKPSYDLLRLFKSLCSLCEYFKLGYLSRRGVRPVVLDVYRQTRMWGRGALNPANQARSTRVAKVEEGNRYNDGQTSKDAANGDARGKHSTSTARL
ncbi:hypothetical protein FIBSPDRAFT_870235 [Athelia psychrophila]|uniref:Uncharacterized protein n=1 Tax=Athelia psychrophila TaxID=1759441 RepID=A0A166BAM0_9AGAM|nr:hypothetical protein FIBSPDRAFT_870235 [Fibularhizoctonia sp. CBS 109695]